MCVVTMNAPSARGSPTRRAVLRPRLDGPGRPLRRLCVRCSTLHGRRQPRRPRSRIPGARDAPSPRPRHPGTAIPTSRGGAPMRYTRLGATGLEVSRICLGCMSYGVPGARQPPWSLDEEASRPFFRRALEAGINFFDTANVYSDGSSEEIIGRALSDFADRDEVVIATKVHGRMRPGPERRRPVPQGDPDRDRPQPAPARHRLRRPLPDPPLGPRRRRSRRRSRRCTTW